jgi:hypothetical protein
MLYEIWMKIEETNTKREKSYREVWRIEEKTHEPYFQPILGQVFERPELSFKAPVESEQWYVLLEGTQDNCFKEGRALIRGFINERVFRIKD